MKITEKSKILEIVEECPQLEEVFKPYDEIIGKCVMCNHLFDTLEEFSELYKLDIEAILIELNSNGIQE